jgi:2-polyprenyl-3-methyl-5-hydroxy-6-metoxy-1,4-benzoquinol methylase
MRRCDICGSLLRQGVASWHFECDECGTEHSAFEPRINAGTADTLPDEHLRVIGLAPAREEAYRRLFAHLDELRRGQRGSLLEVGSAHGWFLRSAARRFDRVVGIEPDDDVRECPSDVSVEVRSGYFPESVSSDESFDVVVFNDVFEHIPAARDVAAAAARVLRKDGIAVVNLPVRGVLYRTAKLIYSAGISGPVERLWQKGFPSPHLYYFSSEGLVRLYREVGCNCERIVSMPTLRLRGLWPRIRYAKSGTAAAAATYVCAFLARPVLSVLPADVRCFFFRRAKRTAESSALETALTFPVEGVGAIGCLQRARRHDAVDHFGGLDHLHAPVVGAVGERLSVVARCAGKFLSRPENRHRAVSIAKRHPRHGRPE